MVMLLVLMQSLLSHFVLGMSFMVVMVLCFSDSRFLLPIHPHGVSASSWNEVVFDIILISGIFQCEWLVKLVFPVGAGGIPFLSWLCLVIIVVRIDANHLRFGGLLRLKIGMVIRFLAWVVVLLVVIDVGLVR